jgi:hypothetical protein
VLGVLRFCCSGENYPPGLRVPVTPHVMLCLHKDRAGSLSHVYSTLGSSKFGRQRRFYLLNI